MARFLFVAPARVSGEVFGPFDVRGPSPIICEAPIDALSLAACGFPALVLCGINRAATTGPAWLRLVCVLRTVFPAFDADQAGDTIIGFMNHLCEACAWCKATGA